MIGPESCPRRREGILAQRASDTQLLLNLSSGHYYALNEVGTRVWELSDGSRSVAEVAAAIAEEYDAPVEEIQADVIDLLRDLLNEQLVVEDR